MDLSWRFSATNLAVRVFACKSIETALSVTTSQESFAFAQPADETCVLCCQNAHSKHQELF